MSNDQQAPLRDMTGEVSPDASFDGRGTDDEDVVVPSFNLDDGDTKDIDLDLQGTTQSTIPKPTSCGSCWSCESCPWSSILKSMTSLPIKSTRSLTPAKA